MEEARHTHTFSGLGSWFPRTGYTGVFGNICSCSVIFFITSIFVVTLESHTAWSTISPVM